MKCPQASDIGDLTKQIQDLMDGSLPDEGWGADCLVLCESVNFLSEIANRGDQHNQFPSNRRYHVSLKSNLCMFKSNILIDTSLFWIFLLIKIISLHSVINK